MFRPRIRDAIASTIDGGAGNGSATLWRVVYEVRLALNEMRNAAERRQRPAMKSEERPSYAIGDISQRIKSY